jgi:hypothetical protein
VNGDREEPDTLDASDEGLRQFREHRYAEVVPVRSERELDRQAAREAGQHDADRGRTVRAVPWLGRARDRIKVKHRHWEKRQNGWSHCKRCGFAAPTSADDLKIGHQDEHAERDRVLVMQAEDIERLIETAHDFQEQLDVAGQELAHERLRINALLLALGHPDSDALQAAVEQVMAYARDYNSRAERTARDQEEER